MTVAISNFDSERLNSSIAPERYCQNPTKVDIVAHFSACTSLGYLRPTGPAFHERPEACQAVKGLKVWEKHCGFSPRVPGYAWEQVVLKLEPATVAQTSAGFAIGSFASGQANFIAAIRELASNPEVFRGTELEKSLSCPRGRLKERNQSIKQLARQALREWETSEQDEASLKEVFGI